MNRKQREKLLDGFMGLAYSFAAFSSGLSAYQQNVKGFIYAGWTIILMFLIAKNYKEDWYMSFILDYLIFPLIMPTMIGIATIIASRWPEK